MNLMNWQVMKFKPHSICIYMVVLVLFLTFSGCFSRKGIKKVKVEKIVPRMIVLPFDCAELTVEEKMTKGFIENIHEKVIVLDSEKLQFYLTTRSVHMDEIDLSSSSITKSFNRVLRNEAVLKRFFEQSQIQYLVMGKAKEKLLGELEIGNLITAETAQMKLIGFQRGEVLLEESFKQGLLEVVAPERIGSKFAAKVNKKLKKIWKEERRKEKQLKKERRRQLNEKNN
ncbi:MAG: hypothetical protein A3I11_01635 [Elusimicrobia bacterium RIFCSPLOWO2_02_FULL_39_32]|nr:MAG: hypothetical protein A3B80_06120 [Elusimicrobia bacterium RIFCSPHIGHO2_02_FULL_39_36]OGR92378.1 MAG: hypothetical protein A3I11_01635 [Elusimicrobia bacterium RIFCSPLOWO2_02_FULL_39_32]OGR98921.1 MAG: hypothetical protein A3G85_03940 [Elusimicrobia bacterium RIFCSPLOWO2_12_FULL_39_28]